MLGGAVVPFGGPLGAFPAGAVLLAAGALSFAAGVASFPAGAVPDSGGTAFTGAVLSWPPLAAVSFFAVLFPGASIATVSDVPVTLSVARRCRLLGRGGGLLHCLPGGAVAGRLLGGGGDLLDRAGRGGGHLRRCGRAVGIALGVTLAELGGELVGELPEQLVADVGHHAAAELGRPAGDVQVGQHVDPGDRRPRPPAWR